MMIEIAGPSCSVTALICHALLITSKSYTKELSHLHKEAGVGILVMLSCRSFDEVARFCPKRKSKRQDEAPHRCILVSVFIGIVRESYHALHGDNTLHEEASKDVS